MKIATKFPTIDLVIKLMYFSLNKQYLDNQTISGIK